MKKIRVIFGILPVLLWFLWIGSASAQYQGPSTADEILPVTISQLPLTNVRSGSIRTVTNALNESDCIVGGGTSIHVCVWDGVAWESVGPAGFITRVTFAQLPAAPESGDVRIITNTNGAACNGGGATPLTCYWNGAAWLLLPAGSAVAAESDPIVGAINGIVRANGAGVISAAVAGTHYVAPDAELTAIAGLTSAADTCFRFTGAGTAAVFTCTTFGLSLIDDANAAAGQATLGLVIGTNVQAFDADLAALAANATDGLWAHTGAGTGSARTITGITNQIAVANGDGVAGNPTLSIPTNPTLPGNTTGTFIGNITGNVTGNVSGTSAALAANGANCSAGSAPLGVDASGAAESCTAYLPLTAGSGAALTGELYLDNLGFKLQPSDTNPTCNAGEYGMYAKTTGTDIIFCQNGVTSTLDSLAGGGGSFTIQEVDLSPGGAATILNVPNGSLSLVGGTEWTLSIAGAGDVSSTLAFSADNSCIRSDGTSKNIQDSGATCTIDDSGNINTTGSVSTGIGTGVSGKITFTGSGSGSAAITVRAGAGTPADIALPDATGAANSFLMSNGATPQLTSWQASTGTTSVVLADSPVLTGTPTLASPSATTITAQVFKSTAADPADGGPVRLGNSELLEWEANPTGTDITFGADANNVLTSSVPINATTGFRIGGAAASGNGLVGNGTNFVSTAIPLSITGTGNQIAASAATGAITLTIPTDFSLASHTSSIPYPSGAAPSVASAGRIAFDNDIWAASHGTLVFHDGTASVSVVATTTTDTPSNGQVPKWNTGGTITWENDTGAGVGCVTGGSNNQIVTDDGATGCASEPDWTIDSATHILAGGASGILDLSATPVATGLKLPDGAGANPTADAQLAFDTTSHRPVFGCNAATCTVLVAGDAIGAATATTPSANDNDTSVATTAFVQTELTGYAADTATFTNKTLDATTAGNIVTIDHETWYEVAGCDNATAGQIWNHNTANPPGYNCEGTNNRIATADFDGTTSEGFNGSWVLPTGWTGAIDIMFRWKAVTTTSPVAWCFQMAKVTPGATSDPSLPAQATGNCVSTAAAGTTLQEVNSVITNVTCTSCAAGDRVGWRLSRDPAEVSTRTDTLSGDAKLIQFGRIFRVAH